MTDALTLLTGKSLRFHSESEGERHYLVVEFPQVEKLTYERWADWGPMFRWTLPRDARILIHDSEGTRESDQRIVELISPILATIRRKHPYQLDIRDTERGLSYRLFLDEALQVQKVETERFGTSRRIMTHPETSRRSQQDTRSAAR